jgi:hypothetical protein
LGPTSPEAPLGLLGIHKLEAILQAAGEAKYTADLVQTVVPAAFADKILYGAPVLAPTGSLGQTVVSINTSAALGVRGVSSFVSAQDLKDIGASNTCGPYTVFATADAPIQYVGQYVGIILGCSLEVAQRAAKLVAITCTDSSSTNSTVSSSAAIPSLDFPAVSTPPLPTSLHNSGNGSAPITVSGSISTNGQKHFTMETNVTLCVPSDSRSASGAGSHLSIWTSTQGCPDALSTIAGCLNRKESELTVNCTLCGGGYGGKQWLNYPCNAAVAVASSKLGVPVLMQLSRNDDMFTLGGRPSVDVQFSATYTTNSRVSDMTNASSTVEWVCSLCTFINHAGERCEICEGLRPETKPVTAIATHSPAFAVYTHAAGSMERVKIVKAHSDAEGGGFTVFLESIGRERQTVAERLVLERDATYSLASADAAGAATIPTIASIDVTSTIDIGLNGYEVGSTIVFAEAALHHPLPQVHATCLGGYAIPGATMKTLITKSPIPMNGTSLGSIVLRMIHCMAHEPFSYLSFGVAPSLPLKESCAPLEISRV